MTALMQTQLDTVVSMLLTRLGGACAWLWKSYRKVETRDKATEAGLSPSCVRSSGSATICSAICMSH